MLEALFATSEGRRKAVFSCCPPTLCVQRMSRLLEQHQQSPESAAGVWFVCSAFQHEMAATKAKAVLQDVGKVVTAQITSSIILQNQAVGECSDVTAWLREGNTEGKLS